MLHLFYLINHILYYNLILPYFIINQFHFYNNKFKFIPKTMKFNEKYKRLYASQYNMHTKSNMPYN